MTSSPAYDGDDFYCDVALVDVAALDVVEETSRCWPTTTPGPIARSMSW